MKKQNILSLAQLRELSNPVIDSIRSIYTREFHSRHPLCVWGVPRGGIPAALFLAASTLDMVEVVDEIEQAHVIIDDIIDSGQTEARFKRDFPSLRFFALVDKRRTPDIGWVVFPWERTLDGKEESITDNFTRILQYIGEDPTREGLKETPVRMAKAWKELCSGYGQDPAAVLKVFADGAGDYDEMIVVRNIPFHSVCEHHMLPFIGKATVAYIPDGRIVGLSKLHRLVDIFARRLQVQERLTTQIAEALQSCLKPKGVGVYLEAEHFCMACRGINKDGIGTATSALRGAMRTDPAARAEFYSIAKS